MSTASRSPSPITFRSVSSSVITSYSIHYTKLYEESIAGYLNAHRIVNLAVATGCDALHPGYGFLSENPLLAEICNARNLRYIGPSAEVIRTMGDKIAAREAMQAAGIPVVPGSDGNLSSVV